MGKESANTCIPHRVVYRTVVGLYMSCVLLTTLIEGLCHIGNRNGRAFLFQDPWHVASLRFSCGGPVM